MKKIDIPWVQLQSMASQRTFLQQRTLITVFSDEIDLRLNWFQWILFLNVLVGTESALWGDIKNHKISWSHDSSIFDYFSIFCIWLFVFKWHICKHIVVIPISLEIQRFNHCSASLRTEVVMWQRVNFAHYIYIERNQTSGRK